MDTASPGSELSRYLAERDLPCPGCGYNLRGLQATACPECNQPLVLRVALAEPKLGRFLGALIGLALGVGFHGLLLLYFVWVFFLLERSGDSSRFLWSTTPALFVEGLLLLLLIWSRRRFQRARGGYQAIMIAGAWLLTISGLVWFCAYIR